MKTIKEASQGYARLPLVDSGKSKSIVGLVLENGATKIKIDGSDPDEVWMRLHNEPGKANPRYVGMAGARNRFLRFCPDGFRSADYAREERDYKIAAKAKLDRTVPLEQALHGSGFGSQCWPSFATPICFRPT